MEIVTIDGMVEHDFRLSIEDMLRLDQVDEAVERLRGLLETCVGDGGVLPNRFLQVTADYVEIGGWHRLADRLRDHDRARHPISAIGVTLADSRALGGPGIRGGRLTPFIKTFYFNDDAYPFTAATRSDLLDGYSRDGFEWQGDYQATDATLSIRGIDDLYGAIVELEDRLLASPDPGEAEIRAGTIGACYVAALIHQALRDTIRRKGLPRPLCVFAACDGVYPFFDAPVAGSDECSVEDPVATMVEGGDDSPADDEEPEDELPGEASLLTLVSRNRTKAPVMVLCEEDAQESARYSEMAGARRLGIDDEQALAGVLEATSADLLADGAVVGAGAVAGWGDCAALEPHAAAAEPMAAPDDFIGEPSDPAQFAEASQEERETPIAVGSELAVEPFAAPAAHSLRSRIRMAEPDPTDTFRDRSRSVVGAILGALRRMFVRS